MYEGRTLLRALHSRTSDSVLCASLQLIENMKAVLFSVLFIAGLSNSASGGQMRIYLNKEEAAPV
uniref:Uncharacterized protein n=1 Tax=Timema shepardi TaxID=629360 RepID=A0A7R9AQ20_TIMSH|nr:unnamed protein product [Timema shepardi]